MKKSFRVVNGFRGVVCTGGDKLWGNGSMRPASNTHRNNNHHDDTGSGGQNNNSKCADVPREAAGVDGWGERLEGEEAIFLIDFNWA